MSDQPTSGEPNSAPATSADAAPAAPAGDARPIGSFGTAKGSGLSRGKRANPPAAAAAAPSPSIGAYKPTSLEVITPKREYTHPFASEMPAAPVNEPPAELPATADQPEAAPASLAANGPVTSASEPPAVTAPAAGEPVAAPAEIIQPSVEKAEIKILPPAEAKRPSVSWGEPAASEDTRPQREPRGTFQPDRRERKFEPREPREPRDQREPRPFEPREPRREPSFEARGAQPRQPRAPQHAQPAKSSGGFIGWLKGLFGAKPAETPASTPEQRGGQQRDGEFQRRRHRGGRGRGGYQGDNRGPRDSQPRDQAQGGGSGYAGGQPQEGGDAQSGERRYEGGGGGGRRRRRGGRGRFRDDRGPRPEGQQGGGAI